MFGKFPVTERVSEKYLGQVLHSGGLSESAKATVEDRSGKIRGDKVYCGRVRNASHGRFNGCMGVMGEGSGPLTPQWGGHLDWRY